MSKKKSTAIATQDSNTALLAQGQADADAALAAIQPEDGELDFLPQFRFFTASSGLVKNEEIPQNHYGMLVDGDVEDIGKSMEIFVAGMRFRASHEIDGETYVDFNPATDFSKNAFRESEAGNMGCMAGPELLIYVPEFGIGTLLMGSKSNRRTARNRFKNCIGKSYTCGQREAKNKAGKTWQAMKVAKSKTPISAEDIPADDLAKALSLFNKKEAKLPTEAPSDDRD
jgi:hypothetical protein